MLVLQDLSGKTYTALALARALGGKTIVIDTEAGISNIYADIFEDLEFDVLELNDNRNPRIYIEVIMLAEGVGYTGPNIQINDFGLVVDVKSRKSVPKEAILDPIRVALFGGYMVGVGYWPSNPTDTDCKSCTSNW